MNTLEGFALAEERVKLAREFDKLSDELADILTVKAAKWIMFRADPECKSDTAAEKRWSVTPEGLREMRIRLKMKAYEKQLSSMGTLLRAMEMEWKHSNIV